MVSCLLYNWNHSRIPRPKPGRHAFVQPCNKNGELMASYEGTSRGISGDVSAWKVQAALADARMLVTPLLAKKPKVVGLKIIIIP